MIERMAGESGTFWRLKFIFSSLLCFRRRIPIILMSATTCAPCSSARDHAVVKSCARIQIDLGGPGSIISGLDADAE